MTLLPICVTARVACLNVKCSDSPFIFSGCWDFGATEAEFMKCHMLNILYVRLVRVTDLDK